MRNEAQALGRQAAFTAKQCRPALLSRSHCRPKQSESDASEAQCLRRQSVDGVILSHRLNCAIYMLVPHWEHGPIWVMQLEKKLPSFRRWVNNIARLTREKDLLWRRACPARLL